MGDHHHLQDHTQIYNGQMVDQTYEWMAGVWCALGNLYLSIFSISVFCGGARSLHKLILLPPLIVSPPPPPPSICLLLPNQPDHGTKRERPVISQIKLTSQQQNLAQEEKMRLVVEKWMGQLSHCNFSLIIHYSVNQFLQITSNVLFARVSFSAFLIGQHAEFSL